MSPDLPVEARRPPPQPVLPLATPADLSEEALQRMVSDIGREAHSLRCAAQQSVQAAYDSAASAAALTADLCAGVPIAPVSVPCGTASAPPAGNQAAPGVGSPSAGAGRAEGSNSPGVPGEARSRASSPTTNSIVKRTALHTPSPVAAPPQIVSVRSASRSWAALWRVLVHPEVSLEVFAARSCSS